MRIQNFNKSLRPKLVVNLNSQSKMERGWITDEKAFKACSIPSDVKKESVRKCLALTECVVANSRTILTPFHLGLAIQVYHEFGTKRLIEILNAHGFCVTYTELRRYLTSVLPDNTSHCV
jgi:hypothetical protein